MTGSDTTLRRLFTQVFLVALLVRILYAAGAYLFGGPSALVLEDSTQYFLQAKIALEQNAPFGFAPDGQAVYDPQVLPLYPFVLYLLGVATEADAWRILPITLPLDAVTCGLIAIAAQTFAGCSARWAGFAAAFNPTQIVFAGLVLTDTVALFGLTLSLVGMLFFLKASTGEPLTRPLSAKTMLVVGGSIWLGITLGVYTRLSAIPFTVGPAAAVVALLATDRRFAARDRAVRVGALFLVFALCWVSVQPISQRNQAAFGAAELSNQQGVHLLYWLTPLVRDIGAGIPQDETLAEAESRFDAMVDARGGFQSSFEKSHWMRELGTQMLFESGLLAISKAWIVGSLMNIATPVAAIIPAVRELKTTSFYASKGDGFVDKFSNFLFAPGNLPYMAVIGIGLVGSAAWIVIGLFGLVRAVRADPRLAVLIVVWIGTVLAVTGPVISPKYRLPLEPAWCLLVGYAFFRLDLSKKGTRNAVR